MNNELQITSTGIEGLETVEEQVFFEYGNKLAQAEHGLQWAIGDWYNAIPWGDKKAACERAGLNAGSAEQCAKTSRLYQIGKRFPNLTFHHHTTLLASDLSATDRRTLLTRAKNDGWSGKRLKEERDIILGIAPPAHTEGFDNGVDALEESVVASLPKNTGKATVNAVVKGLKKEAAKLKHEFTSAVDKVAERKSKIQRENMKSAQLRADEQYEKAVKMGAGVKAFLTKKEFILIRSCLHPDKNTHPKATEAFQAFNKLADVKDW